MRFKVGPWVFRVSISTGPITHTGEEVMGLCFPDDRKILISHKVPAGGRMAVLLHELTHAWCFSGSQPSDLEGWCDLNAMIFTQALRDLRAQGGEPAIERLQPGETLSPTTSRLNLTTARYCHACTGTVGIASVVIEQTDKPGIVQMTIYCPHCDHLQRWREVSTEDGQPSGMMVGTPRIVRGAAIVAFLANHPHAGEFVAV